MRIEQLYDAIWIWIQFIELTNYVQYYIACIISKRNYDIYNSALEFFSEKLFLVTSHSKIYLVDILVSTIPSTW